MRCADCLNFHPVNDGGGECRAAPPLVAARMTPGLVQDNPQLFRIGYWPPVGNDDWCGHWLRLSDSKPAA